jgi:hypothetical protein
MSPNRKSVSPQQGKAEIHYRNSLCALCVLYIPKTWEIWFHRDSPWKGFQGGGKPSHGRAARDRLCLGPRGRHEAGSSSPLWDKPEQPLEPPPIPTRVELAFAR